MYITPDAHIYSMPIPLPCLFGGGKAETAVVTICLLEILTTIQARTRTPTNMPELREIQDMMRRVSRMNRVTRSSFLLPPYSTSSSLVSSVIMLHASDFVHRFMLFRLVQSCQHPVLSSLHHSVSNGIWNMLEGETLQPPLWLASKFFQLFHPSSGSPKTLSKHTERACSWFYNLLSGLVPPLPSLGYNSTCMDIC